MLQEIIRAFTEKEGVEFLGFRHLPHMNGINAAMALRAIEKGMGLKKATPILFFSSVKCDDNLKQIFQHCAPARYINKGNSDSPEQLTDRLLQVLGRLMSESKR